MTACSEYFGKMRLAECRKEPSQKRKTTEMMVVTPLTEETLTRAGTSGNGGGDWDTRY
jgi:hypothetical protein